MLPPGSQVEEGPLGGRTDPVVGVEARSQNLHTNRRESQQTQCTATSCQNPLSGQALGT